MEQMLNNPAVQSLMSNPQVRRLKDELAKAHVSQALFGNPMVQQLMSNPQVSVMLHHNKLIDSHE